MLDEVSGLTFRGWDGGICIKCLQMGLNEKRVGKQKFEKGGGGGACWVKGWVP